MQAADILAIPLTTPFSLFPRDPKTRKSAFHRLAKKWHPDAGGSSDVFAHIQALYAACEKPVNVLPFEDTTGKHYKLHYLRTHSFELGTMVLGNKITAFIIDHQYDDLVLNGLRAIGTLRFPNNKMKDQHARQVPVVERTVNLTNKRTLLVVKKEPHAILLRDLITHMGTIPPKHVTWIISDLLALTSFYQLINFTHNGLSVDTVFIDPEKHTAYPIGGWWYATPVGSTMKFLPQSSTAVAPRNVLDTKRADHRIDLECIRAIARACLGGGKLDLPKPFANFLRLPAPNEPIKDYANWEKVRKDSWGPRRFLQLNVTAADVYK